MIVLQNSLLLKHGDVRQMRIRRLMMMRLSKQLFSRSPVISPVSLIRFSVIAIVFLLLESCATFTGDEQYVRENTLLLAMEEYQRKDSSCKAARGVMVTQSQATRIKRKFNRFDYLFASCH